MWEHSLAIFYALFIWWFSTGFILVLDGLPRRTYGWSMVAMTALAAAALYGLTRVASDPSLAGTYISFTCGLAVWAWHELSFLTGYVTGPRRTPCPEAPTAWRRFRYASETVIHHEVAIAATAGVMAGLTWGAANQTGFWTFVILWLMRLSTKLNIFLGVANLAEEFLPPHLRYLESYFRRRPLNLLFPLSVTVATVVTVLVFERGLVPDATPGEAAAAMFLGTMLALAVLEHWFLVLPIPATALWRWALEARRARADGSTAEAGPSHLREDLLNAVSPASSGATRPASSLPAGFHWGTHTPPLRVRVADGVQNNKSQEFPGRGSTPGSLD